MALGDNVTAYWKHDETGTGTRADAVGSSTLTNTNGVTNGTGIINNGSAFVAASSRRLSCADNAALSTGDIGFTHTFWLKITSFASDMAVLCKENDGSTREYRIDIPDAGTPKLRWIVFDASGGVIGLVTHGLTLTTGTWYFVRVYHDPVANTVGINVNEGTLATASTGTGVPADTGATFYVGWYNGAGSYFNGIIDEHAFAKRVIDGTDGALIYNAGAGLAWPWSSSGTTYTDTGSAVSIGTGSGADVAIFSDGAIATSVFTGAGADTAVFADSGSATSVLTGAGADAAVFVDTATAISVLTGSGAESAVYNDTATAVMSATARGTDSNVYEDAGAAIAALFGFGADVLTMTDTGTGVLVAVGSGTDNGPTPPADLPFQGDAYLYDSAGGTGSIAGGTVLPGPNQASATGTTSGATVLPGPTQSSPTGSIAGGTILPPETVL